MGADHGGDAFQLGAKVAVHFHNQAEKTMYFEISVAEVICRTDSSDLLEKTIVKKLEAGLKIVAESKFHIYIDSEHKTRCRYGKKA